MTKANIPISLAKNLSTSTSPFLIGPHTVDTNTKVIVFTVKCEDTSVVLNAGDATWLGCKKRGIPRSSPDLT
ncbi:MAG: hypothetical protein II721_08185 [Bacilli bacterium]|nr:hypothetical protein [Bacilli bacterium]